MTENDQHVGEHHDWHDADYVSRWIGEDITDDQRRRPQLRRAATLLPLPHDEPVTILDVGGGYGEFTAQVLDVFPLATVCLQDFSEPMLDQARARLAGHGDRVVYRRADLRDPRWTAALGGPFDAAVSALAIHNLGEPGAIPAVYRALAGVLRPGGWFFDLDLVLDVPLAPPSSPLATLYRTATGEAGHQDPGADEHDDTAAVYAASLQDHLTWLREAGFADVDCLRKDFAEVFLAARVSRPSRRAV